MKNKIKAEKKYKKLIKKGLVSPLEYVPYHYKAPIKRLLMQDDKTFPNLKSSSGYRIVAHIINKLPRRVPEYMDSHAHNCDEINLILSVNGKLVYEVTLEDEKYSVSSPATIYIPRGVKHKVRVKKGRGIFVCMIMTKNYRSSLIFPQRLRH